MIRRLLVLFIALSVCQVTPALSAEIDAASINNAQFGTSKLPTEGKIDAAVVKVHAVLQVERVGESVVRNVPR